MVATALALDGYLGKARPASLVGSFVELGERPLVLDDSLSLLDSRTNLSALIWVVRSSSCSRPHDVRSPSLVLPARNGRGQTTTSLLRAAPADSKIIHLCLRWFGLSFQLSSTVRRAVTPRCTLEQPGHASRAR